MPYMKCTFLFHQVNSPTRATTIPRTGGWSESLYLPDGDLVTTIRRCITLGSLRVEMLGKDAGIVGLRIQAVDPVGRATTRLLNLPGKRTANSDMPQISIFANIPAATGGYSRRLTLRGFPDARVVDGEMELTPAMAAAIQSYLYGINTFAFPVKVRPATNYPLFTISAAGVYNSVVDVPWVVNDIVYVAQALTSQGRRKSGRFRVTVRTDSRTGTLAGWIGGDARGGSFRVQAMAFAAMNSTVVDPTQFKSTTRKVGRPFALFVGAVRRQR